MKFSTLALVSCLTALATALPVKRALVPGKHFDRVMIIIFENQDYDTAHGDPYYGTLAEKHNGVVLSNYMSLTHPSQPNYIGLISGSLEGVFSDLQVNINRNSIVDLLEAKGISWKAYQEAYAGGCDKKMRIGTYARKHNPFMSIVNIQENPDRCAKIVNSEQLDKDIANDEVPQFVFFTPDMNNDSHDTDMAYASKWFEGFLEPRIGKTELNKNTMFVATFDENATYTIKNQIMTVLFGPDFKRSSTQAEDNTPYNHYSLLRTIEDNWDLGDLGKKDAEATPIQL
ncbi:hypothetical protein DFQ28_010626 [Apophysomyces sp. BC1034]|nr:hypothetical protein DFQ30_010257 [Apophysomyces sp. BC1015]KAG0181483.1 hypothetical protein DFQ29_008152 [Apophysomyces sp. BC1021]KAG0191935.1 hypothetical protein DFQ28_010626 [Apophysomyces sp. BC1034]